MKADLSPLDTQNQIWIFVVSIPLLKQNNKTCIFCFPSTILSSHLNNSVKNKYIRCVELTTEASGCGDFFHNTLSENSPHKNSILKKRSHQTKWAPAKTNTDVGLEVFRDNAASSCGEDNHRGTDTIFRFNPLWGYTLLTITKYINRYIPITSFRVIGE